MHTRHKAAAMDVFIISAVWSCGLCRCCAVSRIQQHLARFRSSLATSTHYLFGRGRHGGRCTPLVKRWCVLPCWLCFHTGRTTATVLLPLCWGRESAKSNNNLFSRFRVGLDPSVNWGGIFCLLTFFIFLWFLKDRSRRYYFGLLKRKCPILNPRR